MAPHRIGDSADFQQDTEGSLPVWCSHGYCTLQWSVYPVSYTHLDVYKRQPLKNLPLLCCGSLWRKSLSMKALPLTGNAGASYADRKSNSIILLSAR